MKVLTNNLKFNYIHTLFVVLFTGTMLSSVNAQSPASAALGYNIFVKNGVNLEAGKSEGPVAMGGDLTLLGDYKIANKDAGTFKVRNQPIGLLVGGKIIYSKGTETKVENGYAKIGNGTGSTIWYKDDKSKPANIRLTGSSNYDAKPYLLLGKKADDFGGVSATVNPVLQGGLINFNQAFVAMQAKALAVAGYSTNIQLFDSKELVSGTTITAVNVDGEVKINLKTGYNVLNATGAELNSITKKLIIKNKPDAGHILVVNVNAPGAFVWNVWDLTGLGSSESSYIFYNFYNSASIQISGDKDVSGTMFAPFADINKTNIKGNIDGQLIALSYKHAGGENKFSAFVPALSDVDPNKNNKPTVGPTQPVVKNKGLNSLAFSFTKGNGAARMVIAQKAGEPATPTDAKTYLADPTYGKGATVNAGYVVYNGTGNAVTVVGLQPATEYYFSVIEYNGQNTAVEYSTATKLVDNTITLTDIDGDAVPDNMDDYPADATKAFNNFYPATGFSTLMFEDRWPYKGDYDFNDLVIDFKINTVTNANNKIASVEYIYLPRASGATSKIGFAFQLDGIASSKVVSVSGTKLSPGITTISSNGTEAGQPDHVNIVVFENAFKMFNNLPANSNLVNTYLASDKYNADTIKVIVTFQTNSLAFDALTAANFNPYIFTDLERGKEIHLADRLPSAKMNYTYFGTGDDDSKTQTGKFFKSKNKLPWALNIVTSVPFVLEGVDFIKAYTTFTRWALSDGAENKEWYMNLPSNRQAEFLYSK